MVLNQIDTLAEYFAFIKRNPIEIETLFKELLIGVTNFFRDKDAFKFLNNNIIPKLFKGRNPETSIRVWVPGCSTGEEAYTLAILFQEQIEKLKQSFTIQIFATDIDSEAVEKARFGTYPENIQMDVTKEHLSKYFTKENNNYRVHKLIRDMVVFAKQDIIKDPPFSNLDLVSCRNLLIYFGQVIQKKALNLFHYALKQNGYLFLGTSESIGDFYEMFDSIDKKWKVYSKKDVALSQVPFQNYVPSLSAKLIPIEKAMAIQNKLKPDFVNLIDEMLVEDYAPPCVIINSDFEVLYVYGSTGKFFEPAAGEASLNLSRMIKTGMKRELSAGVRKVITGNSLVRYDGLKVKNNAETILVNLVIKRLKESEFFKGMTMVIFEEVKNIASKVKQGKRTEDDYCPENS